MTLPSWLIQFVATLALAVGAWFLGHHEGAASVQAKWDQQVRDDKDAADAASESDRLRIRAADTKYEAQRAVFIQRLTQPSRESSYALHATICPPAGALGKPLELGDVPVPGVWLDRLRSAGADF